MYGSWTENVVLWRLYLGIIWGLWDVYTGQIRSAKQKFNLQNHHRLFILRDDFEKLFNNYDEKWSENSIVK